jgi:hypothetical protein
MVPSLALIVARMTGQSVGTRMLELTARPLDESQRALWWRRRWRTWGPDKRRLPQLERQAAGRGNSGGDEGEGGAGRTWAAEEKTVLTDKQFLRQNLAKLEIA